VSGILREFDFIGVAEFYIETRYDVTGVSSQRAQGRLSKITSGIEGQTENFRFIDGP